MSVSRTVDLSPVMQMSESSHHRDLNYGANRSVYRGHRSATPRLLRDIGDLICQTAVGISRYKHWRYAQSVLRYDDMHPRPNIWLSVVDEIHVDFHVGSHRRPHVCKSLFLLWIRACKNVTHEGLLLDTFEFLLFTAEIWNCYADYWSTALYTLLTNFRLFIWQRFHAVNFEPHSFVAFNRNRSEKML